jgi:hypothetical protein
MGEIRGNLLDQMRELVDAGAVERTGWIRENLDTLMRSVRRDATGLSAISGVSPTTVRAFLHGTDSSILNVMRMALTLGVSLGDLEREPAAFAKLLAERGQRTDGSPPL